MYNDARRVAFLLTLLNISSSLASIFSGASDVENEPSNLSTLGSLSSGLLYPAVRR